MEAIYWLYRRWENFLDSGKYFHGIVDGFESNPKGVKTGFGSHPRDLREADWFQKD